MGTQLPDQSPACKSKLRTRADLRLGYAQRLAGAASTAWLIACGTPVEESPQGTQDESSEESTHEANTTTGSTSTNTPTSAVATPDADESQPTSTASSQSQGSSANATSNSETTSSVVSQPTTGTGAVDPAPPTPDVFDPEGSAIPPGSGPLGVETTCNGMDDDQNGVIDDVDATADGVCDCLKVATLGLHGEWGTGNFVTGWLADHLEDAPVDLDGEPLSAERLQPFHVLLIRDVSLNHNSTLSFSAQEVDALWSWVRNGGGLMTVIGYSDPDESGNVNTLLEPFGLSYASDQIVQGMGASVPVSDWLEHPLSSGITQVGADNGYPVVGQGITFARQDEFDVGKALTVGDGHVLVWGDEWVTYEDEWASDTSYQVDRFWRNALLWLSRATQCKVEAK